MSGHYSSDPRVPAYHGVHYRSPRREHLRVPLDQERVPEPPAKPADTGPTYQELLDAASPEAEEVDESERQTGTA